MRNEELELFTSQELIDELMRRPTFLGVVVNALDGIKGGNWNGEKIFQVHFNSNLDAEQACRLLDVVTEHLERETS